MNESMRIYVERRDLLRDRFVAILAHDLRTPLNVILMSVEALIRVDALGPTEREMTARILRSGERMQRMIESVTDFARGHLGGGIPVVQHANDMGVICRLVGDEFRAGHPEIRSSSTVAATFVGRGSRSSSARELAQQCRALWRRRRRALREGMSGSSERVHVGNERRTGDSHGAGAQAVCSIRTR